MNTFRYQISVDEDQNLVHLVLKGEMNKSEGEQVIIDTRAKAAETGLDILCDLRDATIIARPADWFYLFRNREIYPNTPEEKTAILVPSRERMAYTFVDNVTRNLGMNIRIFYLEEKALAWLGEQAG